MKTVGDITREKLNEFRASHRKGRRLTALFLAASLMVSTAVGYGLRQTGISATANYFCGQEEHTHTEDCYRDVYICGLEAGETEPTEALHTHTQDCYEERQVQVCGSGEHIHGQACYTAQRGDLVCEVQEHTHRADCFDEEGNLACELEEHIHRDDCYAPGEPVLTCQEEEHTHGDGCFETQAVLTCDLPTEPQEPTVPAAVGVAVPITITGIAMAGTVFSLTEIPLTFAVAQLGPGHCQQILGPETGSRVPRVGSPFLRPLHIGGIIAETQLRMGMLLLAAGQGLLYAALRMLVNGMFLAYCLHYAGVPASGVPQRAGVSAMLAETDPQWLRDGSYTPQCGDVAIDGGTVGIVSGTGDSVTVIAGDVDGTVAEIAVSGAAQYIAVAEASGSAALAVMPSSVQMEPEGGFDDVAVFATLYQEVDLSNYVDYVTVTYGGQNYVLNKGETLPPLEIADGDTIVVTIHYSFEDPKFSTKTGTYQLPAGISPTAHEGTITDGDTNVGGEFVIDEQGRVTVTYKDEIWHDETAQSGHFYFSGTASVTGDETKDKWEFPGVGTVTVKKKEGDTNTDSYILKNTVGQAFAEYDETHVKLTYQVELCTQNGTGQESLTITDKLNNLLYGGDKSNLIKGKYDENSFRVIKQGSEDDLLTAEGVTLAVNGNDGDSPTATVEGLPPLSAGEKYIMTYDVLIPKADFTGNELRYVKNTVEDSRGDQSQKDVKVDQKLKKTSSFDKNTGRITWTITVDNPIGSVDGYTVWDQLPEGITKEDICGNITVSNRNYQQTVLEKDSEAFDQFFGSGYTFPEGSDAPPYRFVFETEVPDFGDRDQVSVRNTARLTPKGEPTVEVEREQTVSRDQWSLGKTREDVQADKVFWSLDAANVLGTKKFTVTDTIQNAVRRGDYSETPIGNTHYGVEAEIKEALADPNTGLCVTLKDGTKVTYADVLNGAASGVAVTVACHTEPETGHVRSFDITVESTDQAVTAIAVDSYPTHINITDMTDAETWVFVNRVNIGRTQAQAEYEHTKSVDFTKVVSVDGGMTWGTDQSVSYAQAVNQKLRYRIQLTFDGSRTEDFVIQDRLPRGGILVNSGYWIYVDRTENAIHNILFKADEDNILTLRIPYEHYKWNVTGEGTHTLVISYLVSIEDDPAWDDLLTGSVSYRNTASWGDKWAETNTQVRRYESSLAKEGQQIFVKDADGNDTVATNQIRYTVVINPNGQVLGDDPDTLTIEDRLSLPGNMTGTLDYSSLELYHFKETGGKLDLTSRATPIKTEYDTTRPNWFRMQVPNATPLVLQYVYEVDMSKVNAGTYSTSNTVRIANQIDSSKSVEVIKQEAGGSISGSKLRLVKRDKDSGELLSGATFRIDRYVPDESSWQNYWQGRMAEGQQEFSISISDADDKLHTNTLYRIMEEQAPKHYALDSTPKYVIFYNETEGYSDAFYKATGLADSVTPEGVEVKKTDVLYSTVSGVTVMSFDNQYNRLDVKKTWVDADGTEIPAPVEEITVILKRYTDSAENAKPFATVTLKKSEGWTYSWENLEKIDAAGKDWKYIITEVLPSENWKLWTVSYANNGGIQTGLIQIKNTVSGNYTYELPKTGGAGIHDPVLLGLLAMAFALGGLIVNRKKFFIGVNDK